jgi:hypothetical protein
MRITISALFVAALTLGATNAHAAQRPQSKTIVVESPSQLPELAQPAGEAMYLHHTNDGQAFLYVETDKGQKLSILNVSDSAKSEAVAQVTIGAPGPFDCVQDAGDSAALVRFRHTSGFGLISFKKCKHPVLAQDSQLASAGSVEELGATGLLFTSANGFVVPHSTTPREYNVVDTTHASSPVLLATVSGVTQRLSRDETGTLFLLSDNGVTVVRRPRVEEDYAAQVRATEGN